MGRILDQYGNPIDTSAIKEPQTARIAARRASFWPPPLGARPPGRVDAPLRAAADGAPPARHRLFADMEERDAHLLCEIGKRKLAVMDLDWDIVPPRNATAREKADAEWLKETLTDAIDPFEDLLLAMMDGVCHGYAGIELEWRQQGREWLPAFQPRPQEWFRLDRFRRELRLIDASADGAQLQPFGWVLHTHGKAKTGYLGRMGLHRALVWPFLYKAYSLGDFAEFLETYGLPIVLGKYYHGASADEKASLMRAVTALGHDARAIMPADMSIEIQKVTADGSGTPHLSMIDWADRAQSKAVLGQTTSSEARATGLGSPAPSRGICSIPCWRSIAAATTACNAVRAWYSTPVIRKTSPRWPTASTSWSRLACAPSRSSGCTRRRASRSRRKGKKRWALRQM